MFAQMMNDGMIDGDVMAFCIIGGTLLVAIVLVILAIQAVLQFRVLAELRRLHDRKSAAA